jgi:anti-anti-sigma factor
MKSLGETLGASAFTERFGAGKIGLRSFSAVRFDVECSGSVRLLHVNGEIDIYSSAELEAKIADLGREQRGEIRVSFVLCNFIDCSGLRILIRQFKQLGKRLLIVAPGECALPHPRSHRLGYGSPGPQGSTRSVLRHRARCHADPSAIHDVGLTAARIKRSSRDALPGRPELA